MVKKFVDDETKTWEERFRVLEAHHIEEVTELIEKKKILSAELAKITNEKKKSTKNVVVLLMIALCFVPYAYYNFDMFRAWTRHPIEMFKCGEHTKIYTCASIFAYDKSENTQMQF